LGSNTAADAPEPRSAIDGLWPLIGRDDAVQRIVSAIANSSTATVVVSGATGIGTSRVAAAATERLAASGWAVLQVNGDVGLSSIPLAALAPIFAGQRPDLQVITQDPFALFEYARDRVDALADGRRTVILVDDVGLVDPLSLSVVAQLARTGAVKLVVTARTGDPLPSAIVAMWSSDSAVRVDLAPLSAADVATLVTRQLGGQVPERTVTALVEASGGNALYLRELVVGAVRDGDLSNSTGSWQLLRRPSGTAALHDLVRRRLQTDDPAERDVIDRLAACGPLPLDELVEEGARAAVSRLDSAGVVDLRTTSRGLVVQLAHPQYRAAALPSISRLRTIDILLEQAAVLEAKTPQGGQPHPDDAVRIARWRLEAGSPTNAALLIAGARLSFIGHDLRESERLVDAAIACTPDDPEFHLLRAEVLRTLGRTDEALGALQIATRLSRAAATSETAQAPDLPIRIANLEALAWGDKPLGWSQGLQRLEAVLSEHPEYAPQLAITHANLLLYGEEPARAVELLGPDPGPDAGLYRVAWALSVALPLAAIGDSTAALAAAQVFLDHVETASQPIVPRRLALFLSAQTLLYSGEIDRALESASASLRQAIADDDEVSMRHAEFAFGHAYLEMGRLRSSVRWFRDVVSGAEAHGPLSFRYAALGALAALHAWRGESDAAWAALDRLAPDEREWDASTQIAQAWLAARPGDRGAAATPLIERAERYRRSGYAYLESWLLLNAARLGAASVVAGRLRELADAVESPLVRLRARHAEALTSSEAGPIADVASEWRDRGYLLLAAEAFASASRRARASGDALRATEWAQESWRLADLCEGADIPSLRLDSAADVLTGREREVALLAVRGATSQAIANQLFLSIRTVDNHLQSVYRKLGVGGRRELADAL
jgi:DNA-binding CsgD family transcriptional regulator/tetratricopeptide (TPR) repeat protein